MKWLDKFIVSERGQWEHPLKPTAVPTKDGRITMQGVPYPVFAMDETGYGGMIYPGGNYQFPGKMVYEIPMAYGGDISIPDLSRPNWLDKAQKGQQVKYYDDLKEFKKANRAYQDSLEGFKKYPLAPYFRSTNITRGEFLTENNPSTSHFSNILNSDFASGLTISPSNIRPTMNDYEWVYKRPTQKPVYKEKPKEYIPTKTPKLEREPLQLIIPQSDRTLMPYNNTRQVLRGVQQEDKSNQNLYPARVVPAPTFKAGGWLDKYQDGSQVKTYATDPNYLNNRAVFVDNPQANELVRSKIYAGTHGWDPSSNSLVKLDKPVAVPEAIREMSTADWGKKSSKERFESDTPAGKATRKAVAAREMEQAVTNPYFRGAIPAMLAAPAIAAAGPSVLSALNTPAVIGSTTLPGVTAGNIMGAGFAADALVNRLPQIPGQLSRGEYTNAAINAATGALDLYGANMISPLYKGDWLKGYKPVKLSQKSQASDDEIIRQLLKAGNKREISKMLAPKSKKTSSVDEPFLKIYPELNKQEQMYLMDELSGRWGNEANYWRGYNKRMHGLDYDRPIPKFFDPTIPVKKQGGWLDNY